MAAARVASIRELMNILKQQDYKCALTGVRLSTETMTFDHKIARCEGGSDEASNLQAVHVAINKMKHSLPMSEFINWCKLVAAKEGATVDVSVGPSNN